MDKIAVFETLLTALDSVYICSCAKRFVFLQCELIQASCYNHANIAGGNMKKASFHMYRQSDSSISKLETGVAFKWVANHCCIQGNDKADELAKTSAIKKYMT